MKSDNLTVTLTLSKRKLTLFTGMCMGAILLSAAGVWADNLRSTQTVVGSDLIMPYDGFLMVDSSPITGTRTIRFELYESSAGGTSVWSEDAVVEVYAGRFSVGLGSSTSLTETVLDAEKMWLGMKILETDTQGNTVEIELAGRQAIEPAPYAAWAASSADFQVEGDLNVVGQADVAGNLNVTAGNADIEGSLEARGGATILGAENNGTQSALRVGRADGAGGYILIDDNEIDSTGTILVVNGHSGQLTRVGSGGLENQGALDVSGNATFDLDVDVKSDLVVDQTALIKNTLTLQNDFNVTGAIKPGYRNWDSSTGAGGAIITNDNNSFKALMIVGNDSEVNGTGASGDRRIEMYDNVYVHGDLEVNGDIVNFNVSGPYNESRTGSGQNTEGMTSVSNSFCFLTNVDITGLDADNQRGACEIGQVVGVWTLEAIVANSSGNTTYCEAHCLEW